MNHGHAPSWSGMVRGTVLTSLLAGIGYFLLAAGTIHLTSNGRDIATVWAANAVLLALLLDRPKRRWGAILVAGFIGNAAANLVTRGTIEAPLFYGVANIVEVVIAALGLRASTEEGGILHRPTNVFRLFLWAGLLAPLASAFLGAGTAVLVFDEPFLRSLTTWYASDALGLLIFTPLLYALFRGDYGRSIYAMTPLQRLEMGGVLLLTAATCIVVFRSHQLPILFLVAMPITLTNFRVGALGTKLAILITAVIGGLYTMHDLGPITLASSDPRVQALFFQFFLACLLLGELPVGAALAAQQSLLQTLAERERAMRLMASQSPDLLLSFDERGVCRYALGAARSLLGDVPKAFIGQGIECLTADPAVLVEASRQAREDRQGVYLAEFQPCNKPDLHLEASFRATVDDRGNFLGTLASIRDITARKQQELALVRYAQTDDLTGLLNRAGFLQKLGTAIAGDERGDICIALIDMDHFKRINDNRGHQAGDAVLQEIGARLSSQVRATDAVGRLGGDEFVVLMPRCGWDTAREIGNRLVAAVGRTPIVLPDGGPAVTASISCGIARYRKGWTMAQFLSEADRALYEAKGAGRDRIMCA
ncbi:MULTISPECIES: sensor domain-containing diguanylate cyclase [Sphingomonadaceae]|uniref:sensor domain-containing diguanylate cyclase n=1 Tax=Sphingomonadaceae TaxID=41297 RepID=UPI0011583FD9|nr:MULTISPECIES: sensor domain-containing diguanylate cyclase [Sphingomonadaceae]QDK34964.1 hypothetical protein DM450_19585 [Sphingomonas sp. IC081]QSR20135.1 hypothetical protein CA833_23640 [Novosphingobium sp. KA1]